MGVAGVSLFNINWDLTKWWCALGTSSEGNLCGVVCSAYVTTMEARDTDNSIIWSLIPCLHKWKPHSIVRIQQLIAVLLCNDLP